MRNWYPAAVVVLALAASLLLWEQLPDRIPTRWNAAGEVDGYSSRPVGALLVPAIMAVLAVLIPLLPRIDPLRANYAKFRSSYHLVLNGVLTFMLGVHLLTLAWVLGARPPVHRILPLGVGALFVLLGNVLPRTRRNWMFGIRTPWTLSSDRVWTRTHRVGGYVLFSAGGLVILLALTAPTRLVGPLMGAIVAAAALGCIVYSYVAWRREKSS